MIVTIIVGLVVLSVIILVHELGHFIAAKSSGIKIEEFGLGYPPRLFGVRRGETLYSLNAIPFGGFNKLAGEEDPEVSRSLAGKSVGTRLLVISAGSLMNILLALFLLTIAFMVPHNIVSGQVLVEEVAPGSPAAIAGIEAGDIILEVNGNPVRNTGDLHRYIQLNLGREIATLVEHSDATTEEIQVIPRWKPPQGQGAIGIAISMSTPTVVSQRYPVWKAIPMGAIKFAETFILYGNGIISMIIGGASGEVAGPVGIIQITGEVAKTGISPLLEFSALISLIIGIVQLFPIPALDGSRIAFILLELIRRGKRISPKTEGLVHTVGLALLMTLLVVITYRDIVRIISGDSLLP